METFIVKANSHASALKAKRALAQIDGIEFQNLPKIDPKKVTEAEIQEKGALALAGIWADTDITVESLREKAWRKK